MQGRTPLNQPPAARAGASLPPGPLAGDNLDRLLIAGVEEPWYSSLFRNVKETIRPAMLPPLEVTSKPVPVSDIWGGYRYGKQASLTSVGIHILVVTLLFTLGASKTVRTVVKQTVVLVAPDLASYMTDLKARDQTAQGGGGGGDRSPLPASKGQAPRFSLTQFVPPAQVVNNPNPKLLEAPTLVGPPEVKLPNVDMPVWGDPLAKVGPYSNGPGSGGGIGDGSDGGIGPGKGPGYGPGEDGGAGGNVFRAGSFGVSPPVPIYKVDPEYSEEARKARFSGTVILSIVVDEHGLPTNFKVVRPLGMGLDEKAVEAVRKWRFVPGKKDGHAVAVLARVDVNFHLL